MNATWDGVRLACRGRLTRQLLQVFLDAEWRLSWFGSHSTVRAIGAQAFRLRVVEKHRPKGLERRSLEMGILDRKHDLDAAVEVSAHPVGARQKELVVPAIQKIVHAGVFEKTVDDGHD